METENTKRIDDRLKEFELILEEYEKKTKTDSITKPDDIDFYLGLTQEQMTMMTPEQCYQAAFLLGRYSAFLQKTENRHKSRRLWARSNLDYLIGRQLPNYSKFDKYEAKFASILASDSSVQALNKIVLYEDVYANELAFISKTVQSLSNTLIEYAKVKK